VHADEAEKEAQRIFERSLAPGPRDDALDRAAVERAMARLTARETLAARLWRLLPRPATGLVALAGISLIALVAVGVRHARRPLAPAALQAASSQPLVLNDGSEIAPDGAPSAVQVAEQTPGRTTVRLLSGGARFRVRHDPRRLFRVDTGAIQIEDLGTVFRVDHRPNGRIYVAVSEGRVAVLRPASQRRVELGAGEDGVFSETDSPRALAPTIGSPVLGPPAPSLASPGAPRRPPVANGPADLLASADVARRSGHPQAAVAPLRHLVERYPSDPRAPSAAFTLGWVLLMDLGRPREAAGAFATAERIAPRGALAEDAAARVAEAWQKAGDASRARAAARHYEQAYPTGRYVRLLGGITGGN
jgi:transmembrane sensor